MWLLVEMGGLWVLRNAMMALGSTTQTLTQQILMDALTAKLVLAGSAGIHHHTRHLIVRRSVEMAMTFKLMGVMMEI